MKKKIMIMLSILLTFTMCKKNEVEEITTPNEQINGHEYVDLGLPSGLKWATCNVGASSPSECGNYYAWGEIEPKESYTQENCLTWGQEIGDISRNREYDVAQANWGGTWRMPTKAEFEELIKECTWEWTSEVGNDGCIDGYRVTGANGNSIFLPVAGYRNGTSLYYAGSYGYYWSSTPYENDTQYAYNLVFRSDYRRTNWSRRDNGFSVRPVLDNKPVITTHEVKEITTTSAICGGEVTDDGGAEVTARGVCWSTIKNPTITDAHTTDGNGTGSFTSNIKGINAVTTYYVRAYAMNEIGTVYGEEKTFTTKDGIAEITTKEVTGITETSAICGGEVTDDGGSEVIVRGVCWSTSENPTIMNAHTTDGNGTGSYTSNIMGLTAGTTYYIRAYATNNESTSYGCQKSFNTTNGQINGHRYVDFGLPSGLKWATCNVGASSPSEYGNYYAWGEVEPKESYTQQNCLTWEQEIGDINGNPQYDAARANWGGTWRMPTKSEFEELIEECTWEWTSEVGNDGYRVTGPNGNSIFLPAAGYRIGTSLYNASSDGYYWSSTTNEYNTQNACYFRFYSVNHIMSWNFRDYGQSVRPVSE